MKILCIHQGYELYGSDRTFVQSVSAIREEFPGANVTIKLPMKGELSDLLGEYANQITYGDFFVLRKSDIRQNGLRVLYKFPAAIRQAINNISRHDVTYINSVVVFDYLVASIFCRKNVILHVHEIPVGLARMVFSALIFLSGAKKIYNSFSTKKSFLLSGRCSDVIYNGVVNSVVPVKTDMSDRPLNILMIGRFNSWKGQDFLVEVIGSLDPSVVSKIAVKIVGSVFEDQVHFKNKVEDLVVRHGLSGKVEIAPFTKDTTPLYAWSDVVVVPSLKPEPFGLVAIEAMASGRAVIAANHGGLSEIVLHGQTGILFDPGSCEALASAIRYYVENKGLVISHGSSGKNRHRDFFSEASYCASVKRCFRGVTTVG